MSFVAIYVMAGEVFKVLVPSVIAFFAWMQAKRNKEASDQIQEQVEEAHGKLKVATVEIGELMDGVRELRITVDGRLSQLLKLTETSAFTRGQKDLRDTTKPGAD